MNFTPNDLQNLLIKKSPLGYNIDVVNEVLDKVIEDYSHYIKDIKDIKDRTSNQTEALQNYRNMEETMTNALVSAQKAAEDVKANAVEKAENILKEAQLNAQKMLNEANDDVLKIRREYEDIRNKMKVFAAKYESILAAQQEIIRSSIEEI
ncbi:MAG: DivIVA domain-containing protein [Eubacteriales bacterium]|jgi:cell division initiation protein|nr:DivIVA domain-containing protein [Eubacteriales bacterium]